jgi:uncharacterized membrane protein YphA (DoxX/SURF4 family)
VNEILLQASGAFPSAGADVALLLGRLLFGLVIAFMGLNHFMQKEQMAGYADAKGVPAPSLAVLLSGGLLLVSGVAIALGVLPTLAAGALVVFFVVTTPLMHDFWAVPDEQQQSEMTQFLKNVTMLGASLILLALSTTPWPYSLT